MAKNCYLVYRDGYLVCLTNHYKPELCDLYDHDDSNEKDYEVQGEKEK